MKAKLVLQSEEAVHVAMLSMCGSISLPFLHWGRTYIRPVWEYGGNKVTKLDADRMQVGGHRTSFPSPDFKSFKCQQLVQSSEWMPGLGNQGWTLGNP